MSISVSSLIAIGWVLIMSYSIQYLQATDKSDNESQSTISHDEMMKKYQHKPSILNEPTMIAEAIPQGEVVDGAFIYTTLKLTSKKDNKPILFSELKETHTKKIHGFIFNQALNDYQHIHPTPTDKPGIYEFKWNPNSRGQYKLWVNVISLKTGTEEYIPAELGFIPTNKIRPINKDIDVNTLVGGNWYSLVFDSPDIKAGKAMVGKIVITDYKGHPFKDLEPVMGAFAHIVAINEDFETIIHIHPIEEKPINTTDYEGPELKFYFKPTKAGFYKIWVQVQISGQDVYVPFGINVK